MSLRIGITITNDTHDEGLKLRVRDELTRLLFYIRWRDSCCLRHQITESRAGACTPWPEADASFPSIEAEPPMIPPTALDRRTTVRIEETLQVANPCNMPSFLFGIPAKRSDTQPPAKSEMRAATANHTPAPIATLLRAWTR